jgi:putative colanic acid biosynthesis glycosyltransferase WcaI
MDLQDNGAGAERRSIVFTEQFYYPDGWGGAQLPRDLTMYLARAGARVRVICGSDQYVEAAEDRGEDPTLAGVEIRRTPVLFAGDIHHRKLLKQLWFYLASVPLLLFGRAPDLFVTQTNPPLLVPLVAIVALLRRRPFVIIAQDIYPEVMFAHGMSRPGSWSGRMLSRIFAWAYRRATRVVSLGPVMARRLVAKGVDERRIEIISNWATGDESIDRGPHNRLREDWQLAGKFVLLYSGNIGIAHDVETPIEALRILLEYSPDVRLVFIGKGSRLADAQRAAAAAGVTHAVQFRPLVPAALLPQSIGIAHVALVTLREGFEGLVVPSKLLGYMVRGVPTFYVGPDSDVAQIVTASGGGTCFRNGDSQGMAAALRVLIDAPESLAAMGIAAARYYSDRLARPQGLSSYRELIDSMLQRSQERRAVR